MISFQLGVEDLADTRFAISPLVETVSSLWALHRPRLYVHLPLRRLLLEPASALDLTLLRSLVGPSFAVPDFLTPRPATFAASIEDELAAVRRTPPAIVRRDVQAVHAQGAPAPGPLPHPLAGAGRAADGPVKTIRDRICDLLLTYWRATLCPAWPQIRLLLEADTSYRARQLATGGARLLFQDMHPNVRWHDGTLHISKMIGKHRVIAAGQGLLLVPSLFAYKPIPPMTPSEPPWLAYPARGSATLFAAAPQTGSAALTALIGAPRARILRQLDEPTPTSELARRLRVTPSAVSQHLQVLHATGLVTRSREGRRVQYRRSVLGDQLTNL